MGEENSWNGNSKGKIDVFSQKPVLFPGDLKQISHSPVWFFSTNLTQACLVLLHKSDTGLSVFLPQIWHRPVRFFAINLTQACPVLRHKSDTGLSGSSSQTSHRPVCFSPQTSHRPFWFFATNLTQACPVLLHKPHTGLSVFYHQSDTGLSGSSPQIWHKPVRFFSTNLTEACPFFTTNLTQASPVLHHKSDTGLFVFSPQTSHRPLMFFTTNLCHWSQVWTLRTLRWLLWNGARPLTELTPSAFSKKHCCKSMLFVFLWWRTKRPSCSLRDAFTLFRQALCLHWPPTVYNVIQYGLYTCELFFFPDSILPFTWNKLSINCKYCTAWRIAQTLAERYVLSEYHTVRCARVNVIVFEPARKCVDCASPILTTLYKRSTALLAFWYWYIY